MKKNVQKTGVARRLKRGRARLGILALTLGLSGAGLAASTVKSSTKSATKTSASKRSWSQTGKASWYGGRFNGRKTAIGEKYDMNGMTCAHRHLPLGSWVKVTNLHNRKVAFLRVNDRGPMSESLIIDLSYGAAQRLGINGLGKVKLEPVRPDDPAIAEALNEGTKRPFFMEVSSTSAGTPILYPTVADR